MKKIKIIAIASFVIALYSCQKDINIVIPEAEQKIVVEGSIESGGLPFVMLTRSVAYFSETSGNDLYGSFVHDADVRIKSEGVEYLLTELCSSEIPDSLLPLFMELTGIVIVPGSGFDICIYTDLSLSLIGEEGKTYQLSIDVEGKSLSATTHIPNIVSLDSVWFEVEGTLDSLGLAWALLSDPDTIGNAYRWSAQRINHYADGIIKDPVSIAPFNSATDDQFFNGISFEFNSSRGRLPFSEKDDDNNEEAFFFKVGDTIAVKGMSIDFNTFVFLRSYYTDLGSQGSPFASPASLQSNIEGGLGVWAGYGVFRDTIYAGM
jgi:hypothetical protein